MSDKYIWFNFIIKNISQLHDIKDISLIKGYHQIFEQYPGLHPDGFDEPDSGWTDELRPVCAEMWRRVELPESAVTEEHMYYINKAFRILVADSASKICGNG